MSEKNSKDSQRYGKPHEAKTADEYIGICAEKGIGFSNEEKESISAAFAGKNAGRLSDEELDGVAGGYIPFFDECRESWNFSICLARRDAMGKSCSQLKRTKFETDSSGRSYAYYACKKGCFSNLKRDITNADFI